MKDIVDFEAEWTKVRPLRSHAAICGAGIWPPVTKCQKPATYAARADFTGGWNAAGVAWAYFCDDHVPPEHEPPWAPWVTPL